MTDVADAISESVEHGRESRLNAAIALCVAITATFMALCNVKDGNIVQNMSVAQSEIVDTWSFYQAKSTKQSMAESVRDQMLLQMKLNPGSNGALLILQSSVSQYDAKIARYEKEKSEPAKKRRSCRLPTMQ